MYSLSRRIEALKEVGELWLMFEQLGSRLPFNEGRTAVQCFRDTLDVVNFKLTIKRRWERRAFGQPSVGLMLDA